LKARKRFAQKTAVQVYGSFLRGFIMIDELWPGGPRFKEKAGVLRLGTDSVMLAHFAKSAKLRKKKRAIDLGCGSGIIAVLLAMEYPALFVDGVDIQPDAVRLASENAELCGLVNRVSIIEGDLRLHREFLQHGVYDLTVANPPYYSCGSGKRPASGDLAIARGEEMCALGDICGAAGYLTRWGGSFLLVQKPERLAEVFSAVSKAGFEPKRLRFVQHKSSSPPSLVLVESRRGGKPSLHIEAPLILTNDDGSDTDEVNAIYRRGAK